MVVETERLRLRGWTAGDREPFARLNADAVVMRYFPSTLTRTESDALVDRIEAHFVEHGYGIFAAELRATAEFIGFIGLNHPSFRDGVEIGWRLAAPYWNCGLATEGARAVLRLGFETLALPEIVAFTTTTNTP